MWAVGKGRNRTDSLSRIADSAAQTASATTPHLNPWNPWNPWNLLSAVFLGHLADGGDAAHGRALAEGLFEHGVRDLGLALHDLRQPVDLAAVDVEVFDSGLERHERVLPLRVERLREKRDVEPRG